MPELPGRTPPLLSSSIENSPPATIEALTRDQAKGFKDLTELPERTKRNLTKVFQHQEEAGGTPNDPGSNFQN